MKNSNTSSASSRSSGRSMTRSESTRGHNQDDSCNDRPTTRTSGGKPKAVKVLPMFSRQSVNPEVDQFGHEFVHYTLSNQRAEVPPGKVHEVRPSTTKDDESESMGIEAKKKKKKKALRLGQSAMRSTVRITKKTAARIARAASKGRVSERRSDDERPSTAGGEHPVKGKSQRSVGEDSFVDNSVDDSSVAFGSQSRPRRDSRNHPPFAQYVTNALEKLQASSFRETRSSIQPESAWKYLLLVPSSPFWVIWNSLHLLALVYICTAVPYITALPSLAFGRDGDWSEVVNRAIDIFYVLDVVVNFRACYIDSETGEVVTDPRSVARHYVTSSVAWFVFDIIMAFPFDLILRGDAVGSSMTFTFVRILRLVRLAKLLRILKLRPLMDFCEDNLGVSRNKLIVVQLVATIAFVAHLTACGFVLAATMGPSVVTNALGAHGSSTQPSWIERNDLSQAPSSEIYVAALYWAFTMMTTVGFGDIVPVTLAERVYSILAMVISAGTYAYVIASMSTIVALMNLQQSRYYERINELNAYMASRQLPAGLQLRTRQFFRYYLTKKSVFDEHALFDVLPQNLREELVDHHVKTAMHHIHFFHELTERGFIGHIALFLRPMFFPPISVIVKARDHAAEMYFISKGSCEVFAGARSVSPEHSPSRRVRLSPTKATVAAITQFVISSRRSSAAAVESDAEGQLVVAALRDGEYFGEMALLCDPSRHRRMASVRAVTYCELYSLSYAHLAPALDRYLSVKKQLSITAASRLAALHELQQSKLELVLPGHLQAMNHS